MSGTLNLRESLVENFAGDLQYHPRLAAVYLFLGVAAGSYWVFTPWDNKFNATPLLFALGSLMLLVKGIFLLRPSSEGLGLSVQEIQDLRTSGHKKGFPPLPAQAAQIVQDFGAGGVLLWPFLSMGKDIDQSWSDPPWSAVFLSGLVLFGLGWLIRRLTSPSAESGASDYK